LTIYVRAQFDTISIWNAHGNNEAIRDEIKDKIRSVLGLPKDAEIEYKKHYGSEQAPGPGAPQYKGPSVKYVKKTAPATNAPICRSKQVAPDAAKAPDNP
jgi:hypothetical protein